MKIKANWSPTRYSWIVHPLAYRDWLNKIPDNSVDAMQWAIMNINTNEPHYQDKNEGWNVCNGLELFNDFTYIRSYNGVDPNSGSPFAPLECPGFAVPCRNGEEMKGVTDNQKYIWWFNTYPLEYAEFLLVTALSRGVWLHPLAANDVGYQIVKTISDEAGNITEQVGTAMSDSKYHSIPKESTSSKEHKVLSVEDHLEDHHEENKTMSSFVKGFPYGADTAFGYTTLIDPRRNLKKHSEEIYSHKLEDPNFGMNKAELDSFDMLIEGQHFGHTGVYGLFDYNTVEKEGKETFPIYIEGQKDPNKPCYQMTKDMEMIFTFHPVNETKNSNFTYAPKDFVWKYELQLTTDDTKNKNEITVHGYFNLYSKVKTRLDLSTKYDKENMKYIRFTCFEPCSPQHRAWFIPIKGLAFGKPRHLFPRNQGDTLLRLNKSCNDIIRLLEQNGRLLNKLAILFLPFH